MNSRNTSQWKKVVSGVLDIYQEILGLKFVEMPKEKIHTWHPEVTQFEVYDSKTNEFLGQFYLDLYPRDGKYSHAAVWGLQKKFIDSNDKKHFSVAGMVCNFNKPTAEKPSLFSFDEVVTFFHEFGHVMHNLCTEANIYEFSGTNVEPDFVEAPSQMLENWCFETGTLKRISKHFQTGEAMPDDLIQKLQKTKVFLEPFKTARQMIFGMFDMSCHTASGPINTQELWHKCLVQYGKTNGQPGTNGAATFAHITGGYDAGYYGYLWSKVFSCDMFLKFKKDGIFNKETGQLYRKHILGTGGSRDSMDALTDFLGRAPSSEGFLVDIGAKTL